MATRAACSPPPTSAPPTLPLPLLQEPTLPLPLLQELDAIKLRYENSGYVFTKLTPKAHATP